MTSRPPIFANTRNPPQAFLSSYAPRLRSYGNALLAPVIPPTTQLPLARTTKRGTAVISYAEDGYDDDDFDSEGPRRPTGLRSLRREDTEQERDKAAERGKEVFAPVEVQPIWREYMGKARRTMTEKQVLTQPHLPLTLIPIKIDLDILPFRPDAPMPLPHNSREMGIDETHPAYKTPELTPAFRLKDTFLWNLHEALATPDMFAKVLVDELDLPSERKVACVQMIAGQIRSQLEEWSAAALHPLFNPTAPVPEAAKKPAVVGRVEALTQQASREASQASTPAPAIGGATPLPNGHTNGVNGDAATPKSILPEPTAESMSATAVAIPSKDDENNPDDSYRVLLDLRINLGSRLYSDKFEWSLLHPPGFAEAFSKQTCADLGLSAEWVSAMSVAIYEAVLRAKKDSLENGLPAIMMEGGLDSDALLEEGYGWRYDPETLGRDWAPVVEVLSKEEIENREKERERNMRRTRREQNRYVGAPVQAVAQQSTFFADPAVDADGTPMGRGERSKKKRRFRSLSPLNRDTPDVQGAYGGNTSLTDQERPTFRCEHCRVYGQAVWAVRDGPNGPRTLCQNCGLLYERNGKLPPWSKDLFAGERPYGEVRR